MTEDRDAFYESLRAAAERRGDQPYDPEAEAARDAAINAARPRTYAHVRRLLEVVDDSTWSQILEEEISPGLGKFAAILEIVVRARAENEALATTSNAFEESVAAGFAETVTASAAGQPSEVLEIADAMLTGGWFRTSDVERLAGASKR